MRNFKNLKNSALEARSKRINKIVGDLRNILNAEQRIYNKLADKIKLASEKIELSDVDDLKN